MQRCVSRRGFVAALAGLAGCRRMAPEAGTSVLHVAAASNLVEVFREIGRRFTEATRIPVTFSFGSTAQLAKQCEDGAPFDVFAAADREHVEALRSRGVLVSESCAVYARGRLALWVPRLELGVRAMEDLTRPELRVIAVASPQAAPYGRAAVEALRAAGLWERVERKIVYGTSISMARQYAASGNAEAAFTAYSLVYREKGTVLRIEESLHGRLDQALGVLAGSGNRNGAERFRAFVLGREGRDQLTGAGYEVPLS